MTAGLLVMYGKHSLKEDVCNNFKQQVGVENAEVEKMAEKKRLELIKQCTTMI